MGAKHEVAAGSGAGLTGRVGITEALAMKQEKAENEVEDKDSSVARVIITVVTIITGFGALFYAVRWGGQMETMVEALKAADVRHGVQLTESGSRDRDMVRFQSVQQDLLRRVQANESALEVNRKFREDLLQSLERRLAQIEIKLDLALKDPAKKAQ